MFTVKNYPLGDQNGATLLAENHLNNLLKEGFSIISTNTTAIRHKNNNGKLLEIIMLTVILEKKTN